jgi:hypothetical protein
MESDDPFPLGSPGELTKLLLEDPPGTCRPITWSDAHAQDRFGNGIARRQPHLFMTWLVDQTRVFFFEEYAELLLVDLLKNIANGRDFAFDATCNVFQRLGLTPKSNSLKSEFGKFAQPNAPRTDLAKFFLDNWN